jgi:integrase/recombinase XerD
MKQVVITNDFSFIPLSLAMEAYESYMRGSTENSYKAKFKYDLPYFVAFMVVEFKHPDLSDVSRGTIEKFIDERLQVESPSTVSRRFASVRAFCRWCASRYSQFVDPCFAWRSPVLYDRSKPKCCNASAVKSVQDAASAIADDWTRARNTLVIELMLYAGLRCNEVRSLNVGHVADDLQWLTKVSGKGRHFRKLPLTQALQASLTVYMPLRNKKLSILYRLFPNLSDNAKAIFPLIISGKKPKNHLPDSYRVANKTIWRIVHGAGVKAGVEGLHPHALRHTFAHSLLDKCGNVAVVSKALGHRSLETTMVYVNQTDDELKKAMT